jgi:LysM repeat protein
MAADPTVGLRMASLPAASGQQGQRSALVADTPAAATPVLLIAKRSPAVEGDVQTVIASTGLQAGVTPRLGAAMNRPVHIVTLATPATNAVPAGVDNMLHERQVHGGAVQLAVPAMPEKAMPKMWQRDTGIGSIHVARAQNLALAPSPAPQSATASSLDQEDLLIDLHMPHTVQRGETIETIAKAYSVTPEELTKLNPGLSPERPLPENSTVVVPQQAARIYLDSTPLVGGPEPYIVHGHSMVPLRQFIEAKGGIIVWMPKTKEVNAWANNTFMALRIGSQEARINADTVLLPVSAAIREDRTMVPIRYLMTALGLQLQYNPASGTYYLASGE